VLGIFLITLQALSQAPAAMRGSVTAEDGKPVSGAVVRYRRIARLRQVGNHFEVAQGEAVMSRSTSSDPNGAFAALDLPAGEYLLCAEVPAAAYLDPCKWSTSLKVTVSAGTLAMPALVLKKGVFLRVRVNDPAGLLPTQVGPMSAGNLIVGVRFGTGAFHAATIKNIDGRGRDYELVIPAGVPMSLWVFSRHVMLTDSNGSRIDNSGAMIPFQASPGQDQLFTLNVSGRVPGAQ
jgi:hypothetical protein